MAVLSSTKYILFYGDRQILKEFFPEVDDSQIMPVGLGLRQDHADPLSPDLTSPAQGIWIGDRCVFSQARRINIPPERRDVGVVFQDYAVWPHMTVLENVLSREKRRMPKTEVKQRAENALNRCA